MLKALNAIVLLAGIIFVVLGAIGVGIVLVILGDALVVIGVLMYLLTRRASRPPVTPTN